MGGGDEQGYNPSYSGQYTCSRFQKLEGFTVQGFYGFRVYGLGFRV